MLRGQLGVVKDYLELLCRRGGLLLLLKRFRSKNSTQTSLMSQKDVQQC